MEHRGYEFDLVVTPAATLAGGRYGFVAAVRGLRRQGDADATAAPLATPFGEYHGESPAEAESRARESVERWIAAQH